MITDRVAWPTRAAADAPGRRHLQQQRVPGTPPELRGKAKYLRVLHIDPKTYTYWYKRPYISTGPVVSTVQSEGVKRVLGTVPIEADGSVAFRAPPGMALHFQLLDEQHRALQTMRSFVGVMPGEQRGCLGCHEVHSRAPQVDLQSLAVTKEPRAITPPPWGDDTVSYPRYVQPVLDQYCGKCHQGDGEGRKDFDLTPRPGFLDFAEPYHVMTGPAELGAPTRAAESAAGLRHRRHADGRRLRHDGPGGLSAPAAHDRALVPQPADRAVLQRQAPRRESRPDQPPEADRLGRCHVPLHWRRRGPRDPRPGLPGRRLAGDPPRIKTAPASSGRARWIEAGDTNEETPHKHRPTEGTWTGCSRSLDLSP